ncbi:MAG: hypothetical protein SF066_14370 [Thermoanaerobaculia bacterium]|nr:hypothetical protein [Thermoanaerobaculia bacterium]
MNDLAPRVSRPGRVAQRCACGGQAGHTGSDKTTGTLQRLFDESPKVLAQKSVQRMFDPALEDEPVQRMAADTTTVNLEDLLAEP